MPGHKNSELKQPETLAKDWFLFFSFLILFVLGILAVVRGEYLEEKHSEYNARANNQPTSEIYVAAINDAYEACKGQYADNQNAVCDRLQNIITSKVAADDLAAQRSVATSTKGLLRTAIDQMVLTAITAILLVMTVGISIWILIEAKSTTKQAALATTAANKSAKIAKKTYAQSRKATEQEFRAYITLMKQTVKMNYKSFDTGGPKKNLEVSFSIKNIGKTEAKDITQPIATKAIVKERVGNRRQIFTYRKSVERKSAVVMPYLAPTDTAELQFNRILKGESWEEREPLPEGFSESPLIIVEGYFFLRDISTSKRKAQKIKFEFRKKDGSHVLFTSYKKARRPI